MKLVFLNKRKSGGFSLLELVLAIAIFSLSSFAIASILIDSNINTKFNKERLSALFYAKESLDAVNSIRNNSTSTASYWFTISDGNHGLATSTNGWIFNNQSDLINNKYRRTINITSGVPTTTKNINITIAWDLTPDRPVSVSLNTILTKWPVVTNATSTP